MIFILSLLIEGGYLSIRFHHGKYFGCAALTNAVAAPVGFIVALCLSLFSEWMAAPMLLVCCLVFVALKALFYRVMIGWKFWKGALLSLCSSALICVVVLIPLLALGALVFANILGV